MTIWFFAGGPADALPFEDRAWQFGDGVFETIAIRDGAPRFLDWHLERAASGCTRLGIEAPATSRLAEEVRSALEHAGNKTFAVLKLVVTAGQSPRGYARVRGSDASVYVGVFDSEPLDPAFYTEGVRVRLCNTRLSRQPQLAGIKSLNRLEQVLARNEWDTAGIFEGLTFDTGGHLICGTMSNVFLVDGKALVTPDLSQAGVAGIMRRAVLEAMAKADYECAVRTVDLDELLQADEVFLTNSQFGVLPIRELDERALTIGEITRSLMRLVRERGVREIAC